MCASSELDLGVFAILEYGPISRTLLDTEEHTRDREELKILPQQLSFLLSDLCHKLTNSLSHFGSRGLFGGKVRVITLSYVTLCLYLCVFVSGERST